MNRYRIEYSYATGYNLSRGSIEMYCDEIEIIDKAVIEVGKLFDKSAFFIVELIKQLPLED